LLPPTLGEHVEQNVSLATSSDARLRRPVRVTVLRRADVCAMEPGPAPRKHAPPQAVYPRRLMGVWGFYRATWSIPGRIFGAAAVRLTPQKLVSVRLTQRKSNRHQFPIPNSRPPSGKDLLGGDPADLLPVDHDRYLVAPVIHSRRLISTRGDRTGIRLDHTVNQVDDPVPRNPAPRVGGQLLTPVRGQARIGDLHDQADLVGTRVAALVVLPGASRKRDVGFGFIEISDANGERGPES